jgi:hypothetical protein
MLVPAELVPAGLVLSWAMWVQSKLRPSCGKHPNPMQRLSTAGEYGSLNRPWPEFSDRRVYSKISFAPSSFGIG